MFDRLVVVRGGGDLGSGVALRLWRSGFPVIVLETQHPVAVRRTVSFAEAVYDGAACVEEAKGRLVDGPAEAREAIHRREVPVLVDPGGRSLDVLQPYAVVDAIMAKRNTGTFIGMAPCVVGLGPGFTAGKDVHAVVETNRGPHLGRVIREGQAEPNTGQPGPVGGATSRRVLRAPRDGRLRTRRRIGDVVEVGEAVADVDGAAVIARLQGILRGLARDDLQVRQGMKVGDVDPRLDRELCMLVSDKALAVAGGVLEAILSSLPR